MKLVDNYLFLMILGTSGCILWTCFRMDQFKLDHRQWPIETEKFGKNIKILRW